VSCFGKDLDADQARAFRLALEFERISDRHNPMLGAFDSHKRINDYLVQRALQDTHDKRSISWVLVHEGKFLVSYITLSNHVVELGEEDRKAHGLPELGAEWPGVLIGQLGTDKGYIRRGVAWRLLKFAVGRATKWAETTGCRVLIADVNLEDPALAMYKKAGFEPSRHRNYKEQAEKKGTQKQYLDLFSNPPPSLGEGD
jgi:GNAT superfamily N-acetyltransferase